MTSKPEGLEPQMHPRVWIRKWALRTAKKYIEGSFVNDDIEHRAQAAEHGNEFESANIEYLSLQEHQQLLAEAVARARAEAFREAARLLAARADLPIVPWEKIKDRIGPSLAEQLEAKAAELSKGPEAAGEDGNG